jgi:tetratricopeptide (TPR) repeat protein
MKILHYILSLSLVFLLAAPIAAQDEKADEKAPKKTLSAAKWKKIGSLAKKKRSFQTEKATTVAGVRGAEAEDEVLEHLYYRGGATAPSQLELKNAVEILEKDVRMNPDGEDVPESLFFIGQCYEELGKPDDARDAYRRLVKEYENTELAEQAKTRLDALPK